MFVPMSECKSLQATTSLKSPSSVGHVVASGLKSNCDHFPIMVSSGSAMALSTSSGPFGFLSFFFFFFFFPYSGNIFLNSSFISYESSEKSVSSKSSSPSPFSSFFSSLSSALSLSFSLSFLFFPDSASLSFSFSFSSLSLSSSSFAVGSIKRSFISCRSWNLSASPPLSGWSSNALRLKALLMAPLSAVPTRMPMNAYAARFSNVIILPLAFFCQS
mmetsp:Transcript_27896/g.49448  ORF Transcript_27896/g.49448 Transcript_27896/m.49448 type:complete len:217 (+) Transcript_27896:2216-2866(+)